MDLRAYYSKVRETEAGLSGEYIVTVSLATPEGGKAGVRAEVPRLVAARLIVEGRARVATEEEADAFHEVNRAAREKHDRQEAARRLQVVVIPQQETEPHETASDASRHESRKQKDRS